MSLMPHQQLNPARSNSFVEIGHEKISKATPPPPPWSEVKLNIDCMKVEMSPI